MKRISILLCGGIVAAGLSLYSMARPLDQPGHGHKESEEGKQVTVTGELIDAGCYVAADGDAKGKDHAECATKCMASGIPAGILPEGSKEASAMMFLTTNPRVLAPYAAQTIKVEGTVHADMHAIDVKKLYVKDGNNWKEVQLKDEHHGQADGAKHDDGHGHEHK